MKHLFIAFSSRPDPYDMSSVPHPLDCARCFTWRRQSDAGHRIASFNDSPIHTGQTQMLVDPLNSNNGSSQWLQLVIFAPRCYCLCCSWHTCRR